MKKFRVSFGVIGNGAPNEGESYSKKRAFEKACASKIQALDVEQMFKVNEFFDRASSQLRRYKDYNTYSVEHNSIYVEIRNL